MAMNVGNASFAILATGRIGFKLSNYLLKSSMNGENIIKRDKISTSGRQECRSVLDDEFNEYQINECQNGFAKFDARVRILNLNQWRN